MDEICGLGAFANEAAKAGYTNPNGTVNLFMANEVVKKHGKLVSKSDLSAQELSEMNDAIEKLTQKTNPERDTFVKINPENPV